MFNFDNLMVVTRTLFSQGWDTVQNVSNSEFEYNGLVSLYKNLFFGHQMNPESARILDRVHHLH